METYLVSACLLGLRTRYDGASKPNPWMLDKARGLRLIPICPEQLGGLPTPRAAAEIIGGDGYAVLEGKASVINRRGEDVSEFFVRGAYEALKLAQIFGAKGAFLKAKSPSCGLSPLIGVCAALLESWGYTLFEID